MPNFESYSLDYDGNESFTEEDFYENGEESIFEEDNGWEEDWEEPEMWSEGIGLAERRRLPRYRRKRPRPSRFTPTMGIRRTHIRTPVGTARVTFPKAVATKASVDARIKEIKQEISRINKNMDKNTSILDKKVIDTKANIKKQQQQTQQMMLMPLLLSRTPELKQVKYTNYDTTLKTVDIEKTEYKSDDNTMMMVLLMMMMSGGMGATDTDSNMNMMMLALVLSGAFKSSSN